MNSTHQIAGLRVLVVEDEPACRDAVKTMLTMRGASVTAVANAEQALRSFAPSDFDAILADIRLPGMSGLSLLRDIRARYPDFPIILMTGYSSVGSAIDALKSGADDYLVKPIHDPEKLLNTLFSSVERHRLILRNRSLQEQLRASEEKYRAIFNNAGDMIIVVLLTQHGRPGAILDANQATCRTIGLERHRLLERSFADMLPLSHREDTEKFLSTTSRGIETYETFFLSSNGKAIPVEMRAERLTLAGKRLAIIMARDVSERRRLEQDIAEAGEQERQHFGREIHDALCQDLTSITMLSAALHKRLAGENSDAATDVNMIHQISKRAVAFSKRLCAGLFPSEIESQGLITALESLARETSQIFRVSCEVSADPSAAPREKNASLHLYRIVQEAITNSVKHGGAAKIVIRLLRRPNGCSELTIEDDGKGFGPVAANDKHFGMKIMSYRARVLGGTLYVGNRKQGGAIVSCTWP